MLDKSNSELNFSRLPKGNPSFPAIRQRNCIYVDKTAMIAEIARNERYVFLSRPRRFGKSLLVSTFASLFEHGLRYFKGLAIEKTWKDKTYPVVHLDFSSLCYTEDEKEFRRALESHLLVNFSPLGFSYSEKVNFSFMESFSIFLDKPPCGPFVLLIDEYDAPLTEQLDNPDFFETILGILDNFFLRLKSGSGAFRFLFITGITKFRQTGIFSSLNNLTDISLNPKYGELLGFTKEEVEKYFPEYLSNALTQINEELLQDHKEPYSSDSLMQALVSHYGGFCFDEQASKHVLAPWSLFNFLTYPKSGFDDYWIQTGGVSTWLENWIAQHGGFNLEKFDTPTTVDTFDLGASSSPSEIPVEAFLYQTGYLSIVGAWDSSVDLGYPNEEISTAMASLYFSHVSKIDDGTRCRIGEVFTEGNAHELIKAINTIYLSIPYDNMPIHSEVAARAVILVYAKGDGLMTLAECHNARGRSDLEIHAGKIHWVFEFKFVEKDADAQGKLTEALKQIQEKHYDKRSGAEKLICLGLVYSGESKQIVAYEKLDESATKTTCRNGSQNHL